MQKAIDDYRAQNDWFGNFLEEKCEIGEGLRESSSALYQTYRDYCVDTNEYVRSTADFYNALEGAGFEKITRSGRKFIKGLRIRIDNGEFEDFLNL